MPSKLTPEERFWTFVDPCRTDGCAVWLGHLSHGYGQFSTGNGRIRAHHFLIGKPPEGGHTDHLCRNRACIWPAHLEFVTPRENAMRGTGVAPTNAKKTHCPYGHEYTPENTYLTKSRNSKTRHCRTCALAWRSRA